MGKTIRQLRCQAAALVAQSDLWNDAVPQSVRTLIQDLSAEEEQEIDFKRIVDAIDESIFITDKDGYVLYVNPSYSRNTDVPESDVLHRYVWDIIADGVFSGGATIPVLQSKKKVYRLSTTFRSDPPRMGYTAGVPIFDENGELEQVVVSSRPIRSLMQLRGEYPQFLSRARSYVENETQILQEAVPAREGSLQWNSPSMEQVHKLICRAAPTDATILLTGESGVGKEVVADEIYRLSRRHNKPFVKVNCAAIPASLLESELFGYERGAFSGAGTNGKKGLMELAQHGTLLLDEIGEMSMDLQAKLLRAIQSKEIRRVGGTQSIPLDIRYIGATNRNLKQCVAEGTFRQDLYYRLRVIPIDIPPLRERQDDIEPLCQYFLQHFNERYQTDCAFTDKELALLKGYSWPGNVRELENVIEYFTICRTGTEDADEPMLRSLLDADDGQDASRGDAGDMSSALENLEKHLIEDALIRSKNLRDAGKLLNISAPTLSRKIKQYHIDYPRSK